MTIRGGNGPRGGNDRSRRPPMAHPLADPPPGDPEAEPWSPPGSSPPRLSSDRRTSGREPQWDEPRSGTVTAYELARQRRGGGRGGLLRFGLFVGIAAAVVLVLLVTALRPLTRGVVVDLAGANPGALSIPFVADLVKEDLGDALTAPASNDPGAVDFTVSAGETAAGIATRLADLGLVRDPRAFLLIAIEKNLTGSLAAGDFVVRKNLTPDQLVGTLLEAKDPSVVIQFRTGLRLEQMTAYIEARPPEIAGLQMSAQEFLDLVRNPPAALLADYPWLTLPPGASLEGYLAAGAYRILPDATPEELVRKMLDRFIENVGIDRIAAATASGRTFTQVLTLASIVERETADDSERARIAGVFENRMHTPNETAGFLGSDPTVIYLNDTLQLADRSLDGWPQYVFWAPPESSLPKTLPAGLAGYNTYTSKGLPPGPICTPTVVSIDAALEPDTSKGYLYFYATKEGTTLFAKTLAEHQKNIKADGG